MTTTQRTSPEQILRWWQFRYGALTTDLRKRFLQRSEVKHLSRMPPKTVLKALDSSPRLANVLTAARIIQASHKQKARELVARVRAEDQRRASRKPAAKGKASRGIRRAAPKNVPSIIESLDRAVIGNGMSPATRATYGSGLVHNAGRSEARNGYRCSSCRAFVPDGASHDC